LKVRLFNLLPNTKLMRLVCPFAADGRLTHGSSETQNALEDYGANLGIVKFAIAHSKFAKLLT
jgi:hypothetical protein